LLPIEPHLPSIVALVRNHAVTLLHATPGSGKTTLVPLALIDAFEGTVLVLEPRRLATKMAAQRCASLRGEAPGETVGHVYRFERLVGPRTRLIFLTEGSFLRYLRGNPELKGVAAVVLDEFHERHLATDLAYGFMQARLNAGGPCPRLVIMSATLDEGPLRRHFPELAKIVVETPVFPLAMEYAPTDVEWSRRPLERKVMWGIQNAWKHPGDLLVFLPGLGEIKRVRDLLLERLPEEGVKVLLLHGQESSPENEIMRPLPDHRRIILASSVAESSLTIPGVRVVVDAGLAREAIFDAWSGMSTLETSPCSQASAIQRAGRAARTAAGACLRLYTESDFNNRAPFSNPEILKTDLAEVLLELAWWRMAPESFPWPTSPAEGAWTRARQLLTQLGALAGDALSEVGRAMSEVPLPPRHARVWVEARTQGRPEAFRETCRLLAQWLETGAGVRRLSDRLEKGAGQGSGEHAEAFFLAGFPERIARARSEDVVTVAGETYRLGPEVRSYWDERRPYWLLLEVNGKLRQASRLLPLDEAWVRARGSWTQEEAFDSARGKVVRRHSLKLGALTLETREEVVAGAQDATSLRQAVEDWRRDFADTEEARRWELFARTFYPTRPLESFEWELFNEEFLLEARLPTEETHREWLRRLGDELQLHIDPAFSRRLEDEFPRRLRLHDKRTCDVHYDAGAPPWIEAYIQDFYGKREHPALAGGRVPLTVRLWGPHGRPEQITGSLPGFWQNTYASLSRELKRDYPRHFWPEDPVTAVPMLRRPRTQG